MMTPPMGTWRASGPVQDAHPSAADLGDSFELIPVDDQLMLDDGPEALPCGPVSTTTQRSRNSSSTEPRSDARFD